MNTTKKLPAPSVMPLDRNEWKEELNLSNFINSYYQFRDTRKYLKDGSSILVIGPGQGLDVEILKWKGYKITTFDIDETFMPNFIGSCHSMPMFKDLEFDLVIASHVLEHLPIPYLDLALAEIARISSYAFFYLPVAGRHFKIGISPKIKSWDFSIVLDLFNFFEKPSGLSLKYRNGQHYWEIGYRGFGAKALIKRFDLHYDVIDSYRNKDWLPSYNFILKSK